jgi:hypothetical protein
MMLSWGNGITEFSMQMLQCEVWLQSKQPWWTNLGIISSFHILALTKWRLLGPNMLPSVLPKHQEEVGTPIVHVDVHPGHYFAG